MIKLQCQISLTNIQVSRRMKLKCVVPVDNAGYLRAPRPATDTGIIQAGSSPSGPETQAEIFPASEPCAQASDGICWMISFSFRHTDTQQQTKPILHCL